MSVRVDRDSFKGNANAINRELGYLDSLIGDETINQESLNSAITDLNNWLGDIEFDRSIAADKRALASFRMSIAPLSMDPRSFTNGGLFRFAGYVYGEAGKNVIKYSPHLAILKTYQGLTYSAAFFGAIGSVGGFTLDMNNGKTELALQKGSVDLASNIASNAAKNVPGGRYFSMFYQSSSVITGVLLDENQ